MNNNEFIEFCRQEKGERKLYDTFSNLIKENLPTRAIWYLRRFPSIINKYITAEEQEIILNVYSDRKGIEAVSAI